jgi:hypothetical protein
LSEVQCHAPAGRRAIAKRLYVGAWLIAGTLLLAACGSRGDPEVGAESGWAPVGVSKERLCRTFIDIAKVDNEDRISQAKMAGYDHPDLELNPDIMPGGESYGFFVTGKSDQQLIAETGAYRPVAQYELARRAKARGDDLAALGNWVRSAMPPSAEVRYANEPRAEYRFRKAQIMGAYPPSLCRLSAVCGDFNPPAIVIAPACKGNW